MLPNTDSIKESLYLFAKKQENSKNQAENKQKVQGVGFEPPTARCHFGFTNEWRCCRCSFSAVFSPFFLFGKTRFCPRDIWQKMIQYMSQKIVNCPHCGKILLKNLWKAKSSINQKIVKCPQCGSMKNWKNAKRYTPTGVIPRYYCRDCGLRFSER